MPPRGQRHQQLGKQPRFPSCWQSAQGGPGEWLRENTGVCTEWKFECSGQRVGMLVCMSSSLWPYGLQPNRLLCPWDSPSKNTGMGCHFLLQGSPPPKDWTHVSCMGLIFTTVPPTQYIYWISNIKVKYYICTTEHMWNNFVLFHLGFCNIFCAAAQLQTLRLHFLSLNRL